MKTRALYYSMFKDERVDVGKTLEFLSIVEQSCRMRNLVLTLAENNLINLKIDLNVLSQ